MKIGKGNCHGTFGELVQGVIGEQSFLITFPIPSLESKAIFTPDSAASEITGSHSKAIKACNKLLQRFRLRGGGKLSICSNIPVGKGMASSSADIVAAMKSVSQSYSIPLTEEFISEIAVEIEPTDGVMYDGVVAYDHKKGELLEIFGSMPPFLLAGIDVGGVVDTIQFNQQNKSYDWQERCKFSEAYELVRKGIEKRNLSYICTAATISAQINQKRLPKPYFHEFEKIAYDYDGGLVVAHSGTVMGILLNENNPYLNEVSARIKNIKGKLFYCCNSEDVQVTPDNLK